MAQSSAGSAWSQARELHTQRESCGNWGPLSGRFLRSKVMGASQQRHTRRQGPTACPPESVSARRCMAANEDVGETAPAVPPSRVTCQRPSVTVSMRITTPPGYSRVHICGLGGFMSHLDSAPTLPCAGRASAAHTVRGRAATGCAEGDSHSTLILHIMGVGGPCATNHAYASLEDRPFRQSAA